jgi:hypothetical protein
MSLKKLVILQHVLYSWLKGDTGHFVYSVLRHSEADPYLSNTAYTRYQWGKKSIDIISNVQKKSYVCAPDNGGN